MSIIGSNILAGAAGSGVSAYEIEQSLRFDRASSHYLNETFAAGQSTWTVSFWVKRANLNGVVQCLFGTSTNGFYNDLGFEGSDRLRFRQVYSGVPSENFEMVSTMRFRDPSAWYHIVLSYCASGSCATGPAADRAKIWVNNQRLSNFDTADYPGANVDSLINANNRVHNIGKVGYYDDYLGAYIAEFNFVDGQLLEPDDFGEEDDNGVWRPIEYTGTYGNNNSVYLKFDPSATNGIGHDHSGNGNNWSPSGFTTSGTGTDVMSDTPTTNYATLNPIYRTPPYPTQSENGTLSDGNLAITFTGVNGGNGPTFSTVPNSGKWYFEAKQTSGDNTNISLGFYGNYTANFDNAWRIVHSNGGGGFFYSFQGPESGSEPSGTVSYSSGNILGIEIDMDNSTLQFHVNGTYATKATGLSFATYAPLWIDFRRQNSSGTNNSWLFNFGQRAFEYTPTSGFKALNTANLPAPDIKDGSQYFNTVLYSGTGAELAVSGVGFQPDFTWLKRRNNSSHHHLFDAVRGVTKALASDDITVEETNAEFLKTFDADGFTLGTNGGLNASGSTNVAWNWLAGGTGSSNTDGSITSTVSANPAAGFSIVTYSGQTTNFTWGHGLGVPPSMVIIKRRNTAAGWSVYHKSLGATKRLQLDQTGGEETMSYFQNAEPTDTVFSVTTNGGVGADGDTYVAYCFAEVEGYSKFGIYTGNGDSDGTFVHCGFRPRWIMVKTSSNAYGWAIHDTARQTYNEDERILQPNTSGAEATNSLWGVDILSNGFKWRNDGEVFNFSGYTYIFAAFAEHPFGGDGVSPATAR
jgi:hypothetical protein